MKTMLIVGVFAILAIVGFFVFFSPTPPPAPTPQIQEAIDVKASFAIFTNGTFRVFTAAMYHNQSDDVFIEPTSPNIIHVKKAEITWGNFFATLPMKLTHDCLTTGTGQTFCTSGTQTLKFYINGEPSNAALGQPINEGDQLLVSYGNETVEQIEKQFQQIPVAR